MAVTNEFERDLINQAQLKRPGRVDMIVFQNVADAGDGSPGIQRAFRNYLHEGGMEKDLELIGFGIKGTSFNINNAELQQLGNIGASVISASIWTQLSNIGASAISSAEWSQIANIGAVTINVTQWGYLGELDQALKIADAPTFAGLTLSGNLTLAGNSVIGTSVNINNAEMQQLSNIGAATISGTQWGYLGNSNQNVRLADSPTFVGLTLSANLVTTSTVDGVDVGSHAHSGAGEGGTVSYANLSNRSHTISGGDHSGDLVYTQIDAIVDTSGVGSANLISAAVHQHTDADGSSKITHANTSGRTANDHHAQAHTHDTDTLQLDGITSNGGTFTFITSGVLQLFPSGDTTDGLQLLTVSNIPYISPYGGDDLYIRQGGGTWQNIHADNFTLHSEPLPIEESTDKLLNIKNVQGKLDHMSLPSEAYYVDKDGKDEGMKLGAMVLHLVKTIQELEARIKSLEGL